jgi:hypothetical protein
LLQIQPIISTMYIKELHFTILTAFDQ